VQESPDVSLIARNHATVELHAGLSLRMRL
jgi:hypothetical protein